MGLTARLLVALGLTSLTATALVALAVRQATASATLAAHEGAPANVRQAVVETAVARVERASLFAGAAALSLALVLALAVSRAAEREAGREAARRARQTTNDASHASDVTSGAGAAELAAAYSRAMAELSAMRRRLAATERIAARREVARQIAHEIKNPLAPIRAAVETLRRLRARDDPAFDDYFEEATATVLKEVHRISNIVTEFTRFARLPAPNPEPLDLTALVRGVVTLHAKLPEGMGEGAPSGLKTGRAGSVVDLVSAPIPPIVADRDQIVQLLTNLIQNGLEAASTVRVDPRVVVSVGPLMASAELERRGGDAPVPSRDFDRTSRPEPASNVPLEQVSHVRIVVRDNGPGVDEAMVPRLFEPYATSKEKGTGLGLAIAARIAFEHGGEITYRRATKGGAVFEITLPVAGPPLLESAPADATQRPA